MTPTHTPAASPAGQYLNLLRWNLAQIGPMLPLIAIVQTLLAVGIIIGFGFLIPEITTHTAAFLSTGAPTVLLMVLGLVMVPQAVAQARANGSYTYLKSWPVPRIALLMAELTIWLSLAVPSIAAAIGIATMRYGVRYAINWAQLVGATVLIATTATAIGYAIAVSLRPILAQLSSQVLVFFVMLFSPVTFPAATLPTWFQRLHDVLPVRPAADLLRSSLLAGNYHVTPRDLVVVVTWCIVGLSISVRALYKRG